MKERMAIVVPEHIERESLLEKFDENEPENWTNSDAENQEQFDHAFYRGLVENEPAADVAEVRHGEWEDGYAKDANGNIVYRSIDCSECGEYFKIKDHDAEYWKGRFKMCPFCGAVMDGKGE